MKRPDAHQLLAAGATVVTVVLTAAAFWLSYEHLHDVADGNGLDGARAWAWPGTVDLFIIAGELLILRAALRGRFDWFAYLLAGTGSLGSIALNVAGVDAGAQPLEYVVAAVPPVAALLAFAAVMRQVHEHLAILEPTAEMTTAEDVAEPQRMVIPAAVEPVLETPMRPLPDTGPAPVKAAVQASVMPAGQPRKVVTEPVTVPPSELRKHARRLNREAVASTGRPVTIGTLRVELGLSRREATWLRREVVT